MKKILQLYTSTFKGLSKGVWWLALITLINRAGTMVIPFLSLYLTEDLSFKPSQVGWIMSAFGLGSVAGSWLGGKLTDTIGYYKIMVFSLFFTGIGFFLLQFTTTFYSLCFAIFCVMLVADMFRPAMFVALNAYSKPQNKTRSVTLIRLAINLGFSAGPAIGGLIITSLSYAGLFWVDSITCILASVLLIAVLHPKKAKEIYQNELVKNPISAYRDSVYLLFLLAMFLFGFIFLQYFSTMPLYYKEIHNLTELQIGILLGANGFLIFLLEMPLISYLEHKKYKIMVLLLIGSVLTTLSFWVLNATYWHGILIIGMLLMTVGEMVIFPFSNTFALQRAEKGRIGQYMALYSISFSFAHIFGHNAGMQLIQRYGFENTWNVMIGLGIVTLLLLLFLKHKLSS